MVATPQAAGPGPARPQKQMHKRWNAAPTLWCLLFCQQFAGHAQCIVPVSAPQADASAAEPHSSSSSGSNRDTHNSNCATSSEAPGSSNGDTVTLRWWHQCGGKLQSSAAGELDVAVASRLAAAQQQQEPLYRCRGCSSGSEGCSSYADDTLDDYLQLWTVSQYQRLALRSAAQSTDACPSVQFMQTVTPNTPRD